MLVVVIGSIVEVDIAVVVAVVKHSSIVLNFDPSQITTLYTCNVWKTDTITDVGPFERHCSQSRNVSHSTIGTEKQYKRFY